MWASARWLSFVVPIAVLLGTSIPARADVPVSLGMDVGVVTGSGPWRAAPAFSLETGVGMPGDRFALIGRLDGWTFAQAGEVPANSELTAEIGASYTQPFAQRFFWSVALAPALTFVDRPGAAVAYDPGAMLMPAIGVDTRRRSLSLKLSAEGLVTTGGVRIGLLLGVVYTFL